MRKYIIVRSISVPNSLNAVVLSNSDNNKEIYIFQVYYYVGLDKNNI